MTSPFNQPDCDFDKTKKILVADFCGEAPFALAKSEAFKLIEGIEPLLRDGDCEVILDFSNVQSVSPSGSTALFVGLMRRFGESVLRRVIFANVSSKIIQTLDEAIDDASRRLAG